MAEHQTSTTENIGLVYSYNDFFRDPEGYVRVLNRQMTQDIRKATDIPAILAIRNTYHDILTSISRDSELINEGEASKSETSKTAQMKSAAKRMYDFMKGFDEGRDGIKSSNNSPTYDFGYHVAQNAATRLGEQPAINEIPNEKKGYMSLNFLENSSIYSDVKSQG